MSSIKGKRKVQGVSQSQAAALSRHQEEEETDKTKHITHMSATSMLLLANSYSVVKLCWFWLLSRINTIDNDELTEEGSIYLTEYT